ncbi:nitrilase family protein [Cellulophaga sp. E16_2]|uniref:nitrilase family protein n=1 Tax=unclassified Cellulophaga TaxID=2634405 RepID=UPI0013FD8E09|nr:MULTISPECIES: nitrilase family protein [unclassified Cellulophaga]MBO0590911.1 nitrilase family protein [Cellulophaga sp. E16_2]
MSKSLNIALLQTELFWEQPEKNRIHISNAIKELRPEVDLLLLPEMFTTGFTMSPENIDAIEGSRTLDWMRELATAKQLAISGSIVFKEKGKYYNRLFFVEPSKVSIYDKRHTFTLAGESDVYTAGKAKTIIDFKGFKICPLICYDLRFPVWSRNVEHYDLLIYVANWPKTRINAWDVLLKARAIENMSYCIGVNRIGIDEIGHEYPGHSAVYDALGKEVLFSNKPEICYVTLDKEHIKTTRRKLKFLEDQDKFNLEE